MAFVEVRFPEDISYGSSGGPIYSTDVVMTDGGYEKRNVNWSQARGRYNVAHGVKTQTQLDELIAFFRARKGRAYGFRFKDWSDFQLQDELIGTGDGVSTEFQLVKRYESGGVSESRIIAKPLESNVSVAVDGVEQSAGFQLDATTGVVSFDVPPALGEEIRVSGEFDVPVRFDTDRLSASLDAYGVRSWNDIPLVEIRV